MTKTSKKPLVIIVLTLLCVACLCLFAACEPTPQDDAVTYTVTVKTDATTPASGVKVSIKKGGATYGTAQETGEDGKATFALVPDSYEVVLSNLPAHYQVPSDAALTLTAENRDCTVTLERKFAYEVSLVNAADDTPYYAEGVEVMICDLNGTCLQPVALEANGVALIEEDKSDYHVKVTGLKNAAYVCDEDGYYTGKDFSATDTTMTIKLYPATDVESVTPLTAEEKQLGGYDADATVYKHTKKLASGETAYYMINPKFNSQYKIYGNYGASYLQNGTAFKLGNVGNILPSVIGVSVGVNANTYYFNVTNASDEEKEIEFFVEAPTASYTEVEKAGSVNVTIGQANAKAVVTFAAPAAASYKATVTGANVAIACATSQYFLDNAEYTFDDKTESSVSFKVTQDSVGNLIYIGVAVKDAASYPATFRVTIEKVNDVKDTVTVKHVTGLTDYDDQDGKLEYVPFDGSVEAVYNETDGYYHINDKNGPVIVVKLTKPLNDEDRFNCPSALTALEIAPMNQNGFNPFTVDVTSEEDKADLTKGNSYIDYRTMLRGFGDYEGNYEIPTITEPDYYSKHVNKDGCYPLTEDLKAALEAVVAYGVKSQNSLVSWDAEPDYEWLFACYYYDDDEADPIVGYYELVSFTINDGGEDKEYVVGDSIQQGPGNIVTVKKDSYTFTVGKYSFNLNDNLYGQLDFGSKRKWTKDESGEYTFTFSLWGDPYTLDLTYDETNETITIADSDMVLVFTKAKEVVADPIMCDYDLVSFTIGGETYNIGDEYQTKFSQDPMIIDKDTIDLVITETTFSIDDYFSLGGLGFEGKWSNTDGTYKFTVMEMQPNEENPDQYDEVDVEITVSVNLETGVITITYDDEDIGGSFTFKKAVEEAEDNE